ncbi:hypothetical protein [Clostridium botulinum]|uniref:hypothetical protein n=1 Tax=Clostridium botulinum TaxID=1491 RepID=UPI0007742D0B|nr:hypothetical protein [Clostridium botulinum]MBN3398138.1 hypothetical protein [Clostridium botulinum]MBN3413178.1 hypothetical protein [Clostridium botulinum]
METKLEKIQYILDMYNEGVIRSPEAMHEIGRTLEEVMTIKGQKQKTSKDIKVKINIDADKAMEEIREVAKEIIKKHIKIEF